MKKKKKQQQTTTTKTKAEKRNKCLWQWGPTEIWTRIAGFKVQSANHYTMGPVDRVGGDKISIRILHPSRMLYPLFPSESYSETGDPAPIWEFVFD